MLSTTMVERLNHQINREIYSAYLYLSFGSYAESIRLKGFSNWFNAQAKEELSHAKKIYDYVNSQGNRVFLEPIEKPPVDFSSAVELFERTLKHEKNVTGMIHDLVKTSEQENDTVTKDFLQWFVKEQQEEEESASKALEKTKLASNNKDKLEELDKEFAKRT